MVVFTAGARGGGGDGRRSWTLLGRRGAASASPRPSSRECARPGRNRSRTWGRGWSRRRHGPRAPPAQLEGAGGGARRRAGTAPGAAPGAAPGTPRARGIAAGRCGDGTDRAGDRGPGGWGRANWRLRVAARLPESCGQAGAALLLVIELNELLLVNVLVVVNSNSGVYSTISYCLLVSYCLLICLWLLRPFIDRSTSVLGTCTIRTNVACQKSLFVHY